MRSIIWTDPAIKEFQNILDFWDEKTKTDKYSNRLLDNTDKILNLVSQNPLMGAQTKIDTIRMRLIFNKFYVFYQIREDIILVVKFWDTRLNPNKNELI